MTRLRETCTRLLWFFRKRTLDRDFAQELAAHIDMAVDDYVQQGIPLAEARRLALVRLGGVGPSRQLHRESRGLPWLDGVAQDINYALLALRRSPGFSATVIATLAIGIGVNAAVFTVTNAVLFKGFRQVERNDRIVYLDTVERGRGCCCSTSTLH
jgi:hypothetical protein